MKCSISSLKMTSLLSVVLMAGDVIGHRFDRWRGDIEETKWSAKIQERAAEVLSCGMVEPYIPRNRITDYFYEDTEDDDYFYNDLNMDRIRGGAYAARGNYPWHATIMGLTKSEEIVPHCGAAILNKFWLITAAQCVVNFTFSKWKLRVKVGDHTLKRKDDGEQTFEIKNYHLHRSYKNGGIDNNVALVELSYYTGGIKFGTFVKSICVPDDDKYLRTGEKLVVTGMGLDNTGRYGKYPTVLKRMFAHSKTCNWDQARDAIRNVFCLKDTGQNILCKGDSGDPVAVKYRGIYFLAGIVAFHGKEGCEDNDKRAFVANIYEYRGWIVQTIRRYGVGEGKLLKTWPK